MIRIFFHISSRVRKRVRETFEHPPAGVQYIVTTRDFKADHTLSNNTSRRKLNIQRIILWIVRALQIPNIRFIRKIPLEADFVETPGQLLLNNAPYAVQIDNIGCLAFYNTKTLYGSLGRRLIRSFLAKSNCRAIITISHAAQHGVIAYGNSKIISEKTHVVYPFVSLNRYTRRSDGKIRLLFISTNFYLKGGREVIKAFEILSKRYDNLELVMISRPPREILQQYEHASNIRFIDASIDKNELYANHYSQADIFLMPTYQDSFGLVFLEALAAGLPIISTSMYALPEMVEEGKNGFLIQPPFEYFHADGTPNPKYFQRDLVPLILKTPLPAIERFVVNSVSQLIENPGMREAMSRHSRNMVENGKFSAAARNNALISIYKSIAE